MTTNLLFPEDQQLYLQNTDLLTLCEELYSLAEEKGFLMVAAASDLARTGFKKEAQELLSFAIDFLIDKGKKRKKVLKELCAYMYFLQHDAHYGHTLLVPLYDVWLDGGFGYVDVSPKKVKKFAFQHPPYHF